METVIYIRTSTEDQTPENQIKDCLSINKYGEYEIISDKQSAFKDNVERGGFNHLLALIKANKVKNLIVWDFDRIYRNRLKFKGFLALLKAYKVNLHSFRQDWIESIYNIPEPWNDIVSELMINIYGHIAEDESKKKSDRVKLAVRKKEGKTLSYKGKKWGRKSLSTVKKNQLKDIIKKNPKRSIRDMAKELNISTGVVHKYVKEIKGKSV